jgi:hypothetical protein
MRGSPSRSYPLRAGWDSKGINFAGESVYIATRV